MRGRERVREAERGWNNIPIKIRIHMQTIHTCVYICIWYLETFYGVSRYETLKFMYPAYYI